MHASRFWELISAARLREPEDPSAGLRDELSSLSSTEIVDFERCFIAFMDYAYHVDVWRLSYVVEHDMNEAAFFGFRAWLIAQGREAYEKVLVDPEQIIDLIGENALSVPRLPSFRAVPRVLYAEREGEVIPGRMQSWAPQMLTGEMDSVESYLSRHPRLAKTYWGSGLVTHALKRGRRMSKHQSTEMARQAKRLRFGLTSIVLAVITGAILAPWWVSVLGLPIVLGLVCALLWLSSSRLRETAMESFFAASRGVGSATHLRGNVHFAVVHAGPRADAPAPVQLEAGLALLERQAAERGIELHFHNLTPIPHALSELHLRPDDPGIDLPLVRRIRDAVHKDPLVADLAQRHDNFFVITLTYEQVRACAYSRAQRNGPGLELCILSHDHDPATYAHEVLHLFGAQDLYKEESWSEMRDESIQHVMEQLAEFIPLEVLEQSIMLDEGEQVDPANAYAVGWTETLRPIDQSAA